MKDDKEGKKNKRGNTQKPKKEPIEDGMTIDEIFHSDLMRQVLIDAYKDKYDKLEEKWAKYPPIEPSERFKKRMEKLFKRVGKKQVYIGDKPINRSTAIGISTAIIGTTAAGIAATQEPVINFVKETFDQFSSVTFPGDGTAPLTIEKEYYPEFIPKEYAFQSVDSTSQVKEYRFSYGTSILTFKQTILNYIAGIDTEDTKTEKVKIHSVLGVYHENKGINSIVWSTNEYQFVVEGAVDKDTLIKIAESVKIVTKTE